MPKNQIDQRRVYDICDEIYAATGKDPTYADVTAALHCSNSTIKPYLQTWLDRSRPERYPVPSSLSEKTRSLVQLIWGLAANEARQIELGHHAELKAALALAEQQREIAIQNASELEQDQTRLQRENAALIDERAELRVRLSDAQTLTVRIQGLDALNHSLRVERDEARMKESAARGQVEVLERQIKLLLESPDGTRAPDRRQRRLRDPGGGPSNGAAPDSRDP